MAHQSADHLLYNSAVQDVIILGVPGSAEVVYRVNVRGVTTFWFWHALYMLNWACGVLVFGAERGGRYEKRMNQDRFC